MATEDKVLAQLMMDRSEGIANRADDAEPDRRNLSVEVRKAPLPTGAASETTLQSLLDKYSSSNSSVTTVNSSASNVTLLSANSLRKGAVLFNNSAQNCYVKFGATASNSSFTIKMEPVSHCFIDDVPVYTGIIDAIWDSADGSMQVTELT